MLLKGDNGFIYISKMTMSSKRRQCLHLHFEDDNVFSHLCLQKVIVPSFTFRIWQCLQKATIPSFTFQKRQYLQSFILSKGDNAFIYISKTTMSSVIYAFKRRQCLQSSQRLQCLLSLCFTGLNILCFYALKNKKNKKEKKNNFNALMFSRFQFLGFRQVPGQIARGAIFIP